MDIRYQGLEAKVCLLLYVATSVLGEQDETVLFILRCQTCPRIAAADRREPKEQHHYFIQSTCNHDDTYRQCYIIPPKQRHSHW